MHTSPKRQRGSDTNPTRRRRKPPFRSLRHLLPRLRVGLVCLALWAIFAAPGRAVVVLKKGASEPLVGYLVRQDENSVVVREMLEGGASREHTIRRAEIDELLITVSPERLAALDPSQPQLYREYAEELAEKARDPEARDAAVRLFHIAAYHGEARLRTSSLRGLAGLAATPDEERRLRAAAYLHDPDHPRSLIAPPAAATAARTPQDRQALTQVLHAVRAIRQGRPSESRRILNDPSMAVHLEVLAGTITREQLLALATTRPLSDASLRQLLTAEIALEQALSEAPPAAPPAAETAAWSEAAKPGGLDPLPSLDLLHLTPLDPRASVFRDGKWVAP